jgi:hypothetical protein
VRAVRLTKKKEKPHRKGIAKRDFRNAQRNFPWRESEIFPCGNVKYRWRDVKYAQGHIVVSLRDD